MDLDLTEAECALRDAVRAWLEEHVPAERLASPDTPRGLEQHRDWERQLFDAGFAAVSWPVEHGGGGLDPIGTAVFYGEYVRAGAPGRLNRIGLGLCGPTLMEWGTPAQQKRWLRSILTCEDLWCQGFSEPDAGSDLAALRTRGELTPEGVVVNGQKVWTSHSRHAAWMFALVRTDPDGRRHDGLTLVMIAMDSPGVEVRPIRQIHGGVDFSEVFLTDVQVPREGIVGPIGAGWQVAMTALRHERGSGLNTPDHFDRALRDVAAMVPADRRDDPRLLERLGRLAEEVEAYRRMSLRTLTEMTEGRPLGAQSMMGKLWWSEMQTRIFDLAFDLLGEDGVLADSDDEGTAGLSYRYWLSRAAHIFAGTNEIQRDVIAERVLAMPKGTRRAG
ncbi:alkylation response protein AidB-like acyl-CoA dehydrogenase [Nocardioides marinisabuli]|uniref:Alkylation response protein AidB-like acyl-CoA dehydrogenase n=1 Tax=Nocardioides marinisabuli TaxID=419476 RepID=A0A7Y9JQ78_9ACTN|nr:acyl-CoA dehydrogenase family protein [Nocardioides marinisabuli]NYD57175.1 alkylation response protein AidB-like acyl-CoA dehydrogenase [Nocardioides marinisabuli]